MASQSGPGNLRLAVMYGFVTGLGETLRREIVRLVSLRMAILRLWHVAIVMQAYTTMEQTCWNHLQEQGPGNLR